MERSSMWLLCILGLGGAAVSASTAHNKDANAQNYKDQYCTDPRTMKKHAAYTEWADAYSCTRHRCQPGGRNLAIYTVGCKRVEAPESAIECEEVVEDTNMQFPFCCTRLRCLVVVRGEVWTRVLGQPWEVLPAAPWSHMYKMKKPPPADSTFSPKTIEAGPVYELAEPETSEGTAPQKQLRSGRKVATTTDIPDYSNDVVPRSNVPAVPTPDIVIALTTNNDKEGSKKSGGLRMLGHSQNGINWNNQPHSDSDSDSDHKSARKSHEIPSFFEKDEDKERHEPEMQELDEMAATASEKPPEGSEEKFFENNAFSQKEKHKAMNSHHQSAWTDIPQNQWSEHEGMDVENRPNSVMELHYTQEPPRKTEYQAETDQAERKPDKVAKSNNLQSLVDAIGTRMRDIENVVHKMSEKVHQKLPAELSAEKRGLAMDVDYKHHKNSEGKDNSASKHDRDSDDDHMKPRTFSIRNHGSKYLHGASDSTSEHPLYIEDNVNYFNDASNNVRRSNPKEPALSVPTYMAPVENHHKPSSRIPVTNDLNDEQERKKKKHGHKKRRGKAHSHKKHRQDKRKHFNKLASVELDKNVVASAEDSSAVIN